MVIVMGEGGGGGGGHIINVPTGVAMFHVSAGQTTRHGAHTDTPHSLRSNIAQPRAINSPLCSSTVNFIVSVDTRI